ncbi:MAG: Mur ligase domain-containing protein, partial [Bacteroidia bacterium]|nr:Mur ligase domain-containing protein [Bacteroidia bacterium]
MNVPKPPLELQGFDRPGATVFWLGIGGIGMSALAEFFAGRGVRCSGYDRSPSRITRRLEALGVRVVHELPPSLPDDVSAVVYTPAVGENHPFLLEANRRSIPVYKRSVVLGRLSERYRSVAVAGTHGKTTTTAIAAHLLRYAGFDPVAFVGGIIKNYDSNL